MPVGVYERYPGLDDGLGAHERRCSKCREAKPVDAFSPDRRAASGLQRICKACRTTRERTWREANREEVKVRSRSYFLANRERATAQRADWKRRNPQRVKGYALKKRYGVTSDDIAAMRAAQDGRCAICERPFTRTPHTDHDHATGAVRGLLCGGCNIALGFFERPGFYEKATAYLAAHAEKRHTVAA